MLLAILISALFFILVVLVLRLSSRLEKSREPDQNFILLNQRLDTIASSTNQALRETLQLISNQIKESRETVDRSTTAVHHQVHKFTQGITALSENLKQVHEQVKTVSSFQEIFKSPKLRGQWGETSLESILAQYFPKEHYQLQYYFSNGLAVDAILRLPNSQLLPIDSKFPIEDFERYQGAENDMDKDLHKKALLSRVKQEIDDISSKYILPSQGTINAALMFIPAEGIYHELIYNLKEDIQKYAHTKKVILVSPNTLYTTLSSINYWHKNIEITQKTREIMNNLQKINADGLAVNESFRKLGRHLSDAQSAYDNSEKRLGKMMDKVENVTSLPLKSEQIDEPVEVS